MTMLRYFSNTIEATKVKRKSYRNVNYYVPILSEERKQVNYYKIVFLQLYIFSLLMTNFSQLKQLFLYKCLVDI